MPGQASFVTTTTATTTPAAAAAAGAAAGAATLRHNRRAVKHETECSADFSITMILGSCKLCKEILVAAGPAKQWSQSIP